MMDRAGIVCIAYAHGADGHGDAGGQVVKMTQQNGRKHNPYGDAYSAI